MAPVFLPVLDADVGKLLANLYFYPELYKELTER